MKEIQPRKGLGKLSSGLRVAGAGLIGSLVITACDIQNTPPPLPAKVSLSSAEQARLLENGLRLDGSGFILVPDTGGFPEDNFAVEILLAPDSPSKIVSQVTEDSKVLHEDVYTIFHAGDFKLNMYAREDPNKSIIYSYAVRVIGKKNPVDALANSCPVIVGYGAERKVSVNGFAKPKNIILKVKEGNPEVFEDGKRIRIKMGHEYVTPKGFYTFNPEEYRSDGYLVYNQLIETPCNIDNVGLGIGGAMFPDGTMAGHFNGSIYKASISSTREGEMENIIAAWNFRKGSMKDSSGNGYDGRIVGEVSLVGK